MIPHGTPRHDPTSDLIDVDGRPVGEIGSRAYDPAATRLVRCPYPDARRGGLMNQTALRQLSSCFDEVAELAARHVGPIPTVHAAWRACVAGTRAPAVHHDREGTPIPRPLSAWYKASLGFSQVLTALLLADDGVADAPLAELGDASAFLELLERDRWLVGAEQVCAGPAAMIGRLFDLLAEGRADGGADAPWIDERAAWIGVHVGFLGAVRTLAASATVDPGDLSVALQPTLPCLRSVLAVPGRQAAHARRLFPSGGSPPAVEQFLHEASTASDLRALAHARGRALRSVVSN